MKSSVVEMPTEKNQKLKLQEAYFLIRNRTMKLSQVIPHEDHLSQCGEDVSPTKWHLGHTTWFFEKFILEDFSADYNAFDQNSTTIFNSYYETVAKPFPRKNRSLITRPTLPEVYSYRLHVDEAMDSLLETSISNPELEYLIQLGLAHEQQHQELILTDLKLNLWHLPVLPNLQFEFEPILEKAMPLKGKIALDGQLSWQGINTGDFHFDNESPSYKYFLNPYEISSSLVSNAEFKTFVEDGGYCDSRLWLAEGWDLLQREGWQFPLYWLPDTTGSPKNFQEFTLSGIRDLPLDSPAQHLSYYEADAYARWSGSRLPSEQEWERVAKRDFDESISDSSGLVSDSDYFGRVWQWTASAYGAYPGFTMSRGALGEYNGKFMSSQLILRGSSSFTADFHSRPSYRNFFPQEQSGKKLASVLQRHFLLESQLRDPIFI